MFGGCVRDRCGDSLGIGMVVCDTSVGRRCHKTRARSGRLTTRKYEGRFYIWTLGNEELRVPADVDLTMSTGMS